MSWEEIRARLTKMMLELPSYVSFIKDPCAGKILRLRDIAEWTGCHKQTLYDVRSGRRSELYTPQRQYQLSRFFQQWDAGKLVKVQVGGADSRKWRVAHFDPASEVPVDAPDARPPGGLAAQIAWDKGTLHLKPR